MANILTLATETRLAIIDYVVSEEHSYYNPLGLKVLSSLPMASRPRDLTSFETNTTGLLLACTTLRIETLDVLKTRNREVKWRHYEIEYPIHMGDSETGLHFDDHTLSKPRNFLIVPPTRCFIPERTDATIDVLDITLCLQTEATAADPLPGAMDLLERIKEAPNPLLSIIRGCMAKCSPKTEGTIAKRINVHFKLAESPYVLDTHRSGWRKKLTAANIDYARRMPHRAIEPALRGHLGFVEGLGYIKALRTALKISLYVDGKPFLTVPDCEKHKAVKAPECITDIEDDLCDEGCSYIRHYAYIYGHSAGPLHPGHTEYWQRAWSRALQPKRASKNKDTLDGSADLTEEDNESSTEGAKRKLE